MQFPDLVRTVFVLCAQARQASGASPHSGPGSTTPKDALAGYTLGGGNDHEDSSSRQRPARATRFQGSLSFTALHAQALRAAELQQEAEELRLAQMRAARDERAAVQVGNGAGSGIQEAL